MGLSKVAIGGLPAYRSIGVARLCRTRDRIVWRLNMYTVNLYSLPVYMIY